jgi:hypothetical protein
MLCAAFVCRHDACGGSVATSRACGLRRMACASMTRTSMLAKLESCGQAALARSRVSAGKGMITFHIQSIRQRSATRGCVAAARACVVSMCRRVEAKRGHVRPENTSTCSSELVIRWRAYIMGRHPYLGMFAIVARIHLLQPLRI